MERAFSPPASVPDHPALEEEVLAWWSAKDLRPPASKNADGPRFSFIDGPVTANKLLAVHGVGTHAQGRLPAAKAQRGYHQRYQNGFDCQGLWIEVGVERELGLNSKRDIEDFGLAEFAHAVAVSSSTRMS